MMAQLHYLKGQRFSALVILNSKKGLVDKLLVVKVASDLVDSRPNGRDYFGFFTEEDLK